VKNLIWRLGAFTLKTWSTDNAFAIVVPTRCPTIRDPKMIPKIRPLHFSFIIIFPCFHFSNTHIIHFFTIGKKFFNVHKLHSVQVTNFFALVKVPHANANFIA